MAELVAASRPAVGGWEIRGLTPASEYMPKIIKFLGYTPGAAVPASALVKQLVAIRRRMRLTRAAVAEIVGLSYWTLAAWETGRRRPRGRSIALIQGFLAAQR